MTVPVGAARSKPSAERCHRSNDTASQILKGFAKCADGRGAPAIDELFIALAARAAVSVRLWTR
jgi:hypothetical protein